MSSKYVFKHLLTPRGKVIVQLFQGMDMVAVSRKSYETGEEAITDIKTAMDQNRLDDVVRYADGASHEHAQ